MADDFLRAITPNWDSLSDEEKVQDRRKLRELLDGPLNPVTREVQGECGCSGVSEPDGT